MLKNLIAVIVATNLASAEWKVCVTLKNHGTRSEYTERSIKFKNYEFPIEIGHIITPIGEFKVSNVAPGKKGWSLSSERRVTFYLGVERMPDSAKEIGWYKAEFDKNFATSWFYSLSHGYWVNPSKVDEFLEKMATK